MNKIAAVFPILLFILLSEINPSQAQTDVASVQHYGKPFTHVPDRRDVVIYQVNTRAFSKAGDFKGVTARLDSIKALGANVVYIMPIYPVGVVKSMNSPYCVKDYTAINKDFGTLDDLRALVNGAHQRNMAVMLDWVPNHTAWDNPWIKNKSWYLQDSIGNIVSPPGKGWNDVAQLNYKSAAMREEMIKSMRYWILTANIDGFRCDYADGPPFDFWKEAISSLRKTPGHQLLFLSEGSRTDQYAAGFDYNFGFKFFDNLKKIYKKDKSVLSIDSLNKTDYEGAANGQEIVRYTTNHDVNGSDGTPLELFGEKKGSMAAFVVIAYMKSIPFIYNGQEVGTPYRLIFPFATSKINWSNSPEVTAEYKKVIAFRNNSKAIRRGALTSYSNADVCVFTKTDGKEKILVLSNLRNKKISYPVPFSLQTEWTNAFTGAGNKIGQVVTLEPYSYLVLKQ
ncbi:alpha-amylase family glycosyl hydrolase [Pedobacter sp. L105]|uniref:alpha-amylase family glycosyl hydrolase n=1 Tax=Pedobacter sp. L105 TaxID=1641871 RepID=UPI00131B8BDC|nr:alpha-amylase family glycosyl hydrolase [Pedobacter sp. L105]